MEVRNNEPSKMFGLAFGFDELGMDLAPRSDRPDD
jgi:hypothetical protein